MAKPQPFDWMEVRRSPAEAKAKADAERTRREAMYRLELEERASLLQRLGHGKEQVRSRLAANLAWDFAPGGSPLAAGAVDAIVDRVFGQTPAGRPVPRPKGGTR